MGAIIVQFMCPAVLIISIAYPLFRGWRRVNLIKSISLGWGFFLLGYAFQTFISPWLSDGATMNQVKCLTSHFVFGIALGWLFPVIFHFMGGYVRNSWDKRRMKVS